MSSVALGQKLLDYHAKLQDKDLTWVLSRDSWAEVARDLDSFLLQAEDMGIEPNEAMHMALEQEDLDNAVNSALHWNANIVDAYEESMMFGAIQDMLPSLLTGTDYLQRLSQYIFENFKEIENGSENS